VEKRLSKERVMVQEGLVRHSFMAHPKGKVGCKPQRRDFLKRDEKRKTPFPSGASLGSSRILALHDDMKKGV